VYAGPGTGIGPALRKARQSRGKTIEEASRDTRIRGEYLQALEREAFGSLRGDVYVRGFLRSYSSYLGLNPDKVVSVYVRSMGKDVADVPEPPPVQPLKHASLHKMLYRRGNWKLAVALAVLLLGAAGAVGLLTGGSAAPPPASPPHSPSSAALTAPGVSLVITPKQPVNAIVYVDGVRTFDGTLTKPESFRGTSLIRLKLDKGGLADLVVNGRNIGSPGTPSAQYPATFEPAGFRGSPGAGG
jgi:Helix-turn-helix domain